MKKSLLLFGLLFLLLLSLNTVNAQCVDADGDGFNDTIPAGCCTVGVDCDCDDNPAGCGAACFPGNPEICDGEDNDCVGGVPATEIDDDGDGWSECQGDCDDNPAGCGAACFPGNPMGETICNGWDDDCNVGTPDDPPDGDGDTITICGGDCDDGNGNVYPGADEICDGIDNQCPQGACPGPSCDDGCDDDGDDYCDWTMYCIGPLPICPNGCGDCDDSKFNVKPPDIDENALGLCDGIDNDCDHVADEGCPMPYPSIEVKSIATGLTVIPFTPMTWCSTVPECFYSVAGNPDFKEEGDFSVTVTWGAPVNLIQSFVFTVNHDSDQRSCECFYLLDCRGASCWLPGAENEVEASCCGDDPDENYVGGTDGTFACCDNKDDAFVDLGGDECVIGSQCQDRLVGPDEDGSPALCNGEDDDCDGEIDENCMCDSSKMSCDNDPTCPNVICNTTVGTPKSCWKVGGDSSPTGATACCGESATFPNTPGEYYIWNPCDGTDACCDQAGECVLRGVCMNYVPIANEVACDFIDEDCDCLIDEDFDNDNDSVSTCAGDCNDADPSIYPGAPEICDDGIDQDCDGQDVLCGKPEEITLGNLCRLVYDTLYLLIHIAAAITVLLMVIGGIRLIGAADDPGGASKAKNMIKNAIIGLIIVLALAGVGHMFVPECAPLPGTGYHPPFHFGEPPPLSVRILNPQYMDFFVEGGNVFYDCLILGGTPPYLYVWDFGDGTPTVSGTCAAAACPLLMPHTYEKGEYTVRVTVTDSAGMRAWDEVEILVGVMVVKIDSPEDGSWNISASPINFNGTVYGGTAPYNFVWESDIDGIFRNVPIPAAPPPPSSWGRDAFALPANTLSEGNHKITLTVTDSTGIVGSATINLNIAPAQPRIYNIMSCWKRRWPWEDQTYLEFDIEAPVTGLTNGESFVKAVMTAKPGLWERSGSGDTCDGGCLPLNEPHAKALPSPMAAFAIFPWNYDDFCERTCLFEIQITANENPNPSGWIYCVKCPIMSTDESKICPAYGDTPPYDLKKCTGLDGEDEATLGPCPTKREEVPECTGDY